MFDWMDINRWLHVAAGFTGLAAFWIPVFTRKGGKHHRLFGKVFKYCAYLVLLAAGLAVAGHMSQALARGHGPSGAPAGFAFLVFLGYLTVVTYAVLRHGVSVIEHKDLVSLDTPLNRAWAWLSIAATIVLLSYALYFRPPNQVILYALSPIGVLAGTGILKAIKGRRPERKAWFYEHMGAMIGAGIAFHTAFAVFGSSRLFDLGLSGFAQVIPWIAPAVVGTIASAVWTRHYMRKFGDLPA